MKKIKVEKFNEQFGSLWDEGNLKALKSYMRDKPKDKIYNFNITEPFEFKVKNEEDGWRLKTLLTRYDIPHTLTIEEI